VEAVTAANNRSAQVLDAPVTPARILSGEPQNQRPPLRIAGRTVPGRALAKGHPLTADRIAVPAE
jgi:hypothetical protein